MLPKKALLLTGEVSAVHGERANPRLGLKQVEENVRN